MFFRDYIFAIIVVTSISLYILNKIRQKCNERKVNRLVKDLYSDVKRTLMENPNGLTESDILRRYLAYPVHSSYKDNLKRDEYHFSTYVWPMMEALRRKDQQRVTVDEKLQFGRTVKVWRIRM